nr:MarR family winged helix-turn-helix transcriptional regulator [uncultured Anaeromusa sp.]
MKEQLLTYPKQPSICNCMNVRRASRAVTQFYDEQLKSCDITIAQLSMLLRLKEAEALTISQLAQTMRIDRTTLNRNMKPLLENGLIALQQGKDSRTKLVSLTNQGRQTAEEGWACWEKAQELLTTYLGEDDVAKLTALLNKLEALSP